MLLQESLGGTMLKIVTEQKPTKATDVVLFPSKTNLSMYDDFTTRGKKRKKKKQKNGADHHIVSNTAESQQK